MTILSSYVSTLGASAARRLGTQRLRAALEQARAESVSGRAADLGLALGGHVATALALRAEVSATQALRGAGAIATQRLAAAATATDAARAGISKVRSALTAAISDPAARPALAMTARAALGDLLATLDARYGGVAIFGGTAIDRAPMRADAGDENGAAAAATRAAFQSAFGVLPGAPGAAAIGAAALKSFLAGDFAALFEGANWSAAWSRARDEPLRTRVGDGAAVAVNVSANAPALRALARSYVALGDLGGEALGDQAFATLAESGSQGLADADAGLIRLSSEVGLARGAVAAAEGRNGAAGMRLASDIASREGVDRYAAAVAVTDIQGRLESSYALTARLQQLSLTRFL